MRVIRPPQRGSCRFSRVLSLGGAKGFAYTVAASQATSDDLTEVTVFGSEVLDVAIGIIFVYLMLSIVCSAIHEFIEALLKNRAKDLEAGLRELLGGSSGSGLVEALYRHPLVAALFPGEYQPGRHANLPSYIPARSFALALMDIIAPADSDGKSTSGATGATGGLMPTATTSSSGFSAVQLQRLRDSIVKGVSLAPTTQRGLLTLVDAAGSDPVKARENIEWWFNSAMDGVSARFKRRTHLNVTLIAVAVAVATNADSLAIVNALSTDKSVRESLVSATQEYAKAARTDALSSSSAVSPSASNVFSGCTAPECRVQAGLQQIRSTGLPIGWTRVPLSSDVRGIPSNAGSWLWKLLGLLLTAFATSLGAPLWFDMLNKLVVIRSTVKPHEKSPEEPSKG